MELHPWLNTEKSSIIAGTGDLQSKFHKTFQSKTDLYHCNVILNQITFYEMRIAEFFQVSATNIKAKKGIKLMPLSVIVDRFRRAHIWSQHRFFVWDSFLNGKGTCTDIVFQTAFLIIRTWPSKASRLVFIMVFNKFEEVVISLVLLGYYL